MTPPTPTTARAYYLPPAPQPAPAVVTATPEDKLQAVCDFRFGLTAERLTRACESDSFSPTRRALLLSRHREAARLIGEWGPSGVHTPLRHLVELVSPAATGRASEAVDTAVFANLFGNTLNRVLLTAFAEADYGERTLSRPGAARDFRPHRLQGVEHPPDLPSVDPEVADYTELVALAEREIEVSLGQNGVILTISRRAVINDDVQAIARVVSELGRAARRTIARRVWALWANNAAYGPDGDAWFHGNHGNLQTSALAEGEVVLAIGKLLDQTQPGNGERLGFPLRPGAISLVVPTPLWDDAYKLNQSPSSALYRFFGDRNEQILVNPLLTDANDWGVYWDASLIESVRVLYLNGREEPELFLADIPNAGQLFVADKLAYKSRLEFEAVLAEYRGAVKAEVS